ncbi:energy transducer TonB [Spirosoma sp. KUDC1026]|uniref:energy transducer TonB n=1 Tax=Spirosoma sp. KUDC1026 TaxID=2745947 RepID=UPI00397B3CD8
MVNADGSVSDLVVLKGLGLEADQEAVRIVSSMPNWVPGTVNGKPVSVKFVLPISFDAT